MYQHILVPVENTVCDKTILQHIRLLAKMTGAKLLLVHVADGWAARNYDQLGLQDSEEIQQDRQYLTDLERELSSEGFAVTSLLAMGDPASEIIRISREQNTDLIAMGTHGHRLIGDLIHGSTAEKVRHQVDVPVLLLKAHKQVAASKTAS
jgi:nucleotide-binding universal stress UspA family protein